MKQLTRRAERRSKLYFLSSIHEQQWHHRLKTKDTIWPAIWKNFGEAQNENKNVEQIFW